MNEIDEKWGVEVIKKGKGFVQIPIFLLKNQHQLKENNEALSPTELVVLLNILVHWWNRGDVAFPKADDLAKRIGITRRSIDRSIKGLMDGGLLTKERQGNMVCYNPEPLVKRLITLAS